MVFTLGVSQASGQCSCVEIVNNSDCEMHFEFQCSNGNTTSCVTLNPGSKDTWCANDFNNCNDIAIVNFIFGDCDVGSGGPINCGRCGTPFAGDIGCGQTQTFTDCTGTSWTFNFDCSVTPCRLTIK